MRVAYLGPPGTFSEEALLIAAGGAKLEPDPRGTIYDAIEAVESGEADRGFVPFENSIEGTVRPTLDALAFDTERVRIVGEHDHPISLALIAARELDLDGIEAVVSHPQPLAQCARFLRERLPRAAVRTAASTAEAIGAVAEAERPWAAIGSASAAEGYGCHVLCESVEDVAGNVTRFVWLGREQPEAPPAEAGSAWRTTLVFSELGEDHPGALVAALGEISSRGVNMTRIESRPRRTELGRYLFFVDLDGRAEEGAVAEAIEALRGQAEMVRVLGSYAVAGPSPLR